MGFIFLLILENYGIIITGDKMNIKFPKEETIIVEQLKQAIISRNHQLLINQYENVIKHSDFLHKYSHDLLDDYIMELFDIREFETVINIVDDLLKLRIESCNWYFYVFCILIAKKDIYYARSLINRSPLLNDSNIKAMINEEDTNYGQLINLHESLLYSIGPCLVIINFINELLIESLQTTIDEEYIIMRYFDLLNLLYEYGVEDDFIDIFRNCLETIYEIDIV